MATSLGFPMASSVTCSSSSSQPSKRRSFSIPCAKLPAPSVNPNKDPFLKRIASLARNNPEALYNRPQNPDIPPFLDMGDTPQLMSAPAQMEGPSYYDKRPRSPPPDLASIMLDRRIVYIGLPLVPAVTELVVAQLMYLQYMDPKAPIYMYFNCTGTTRDDGEVVARETEGFAIYDTMMRCKNEIHTVALGAAFGQACLLLAAGTKGKRVMLPHALAKMEQPRMPSTGLRQATDVLIQAKELMVHRDTLVKLFARHTGHSKKTIYDTMRRGVFYMKPVAAKRFGIIDTILWRGQEQLMKETSAPEDWNMELDMKYNDLIKSC